MTLENVTGKVTRGGVYDLYWPRSRNLRAAVYDGSGGFIGIRTKFGERYLFTEYAWDEPYHGTVRIDPARDLICTAPAGLPLTEDISDGTACLHCGTPARWTGERRTEGGRVITVPGPWTCDGGCTETLPGRDPNTALFDFLAAVEAAEAGRWES